MLALSTSPTHIVVAGTDSVLCETYTLYKWQLLQFGTHSVLLGLCLIRQPCIEHLVLVETIVAVEDVARLVRHHTYIYSQCESHAELYRHDSHTQTSAAWRESERAFKHHCRDERCAVESRHNSRQRTYNECRYSHYSHKNPMCREVDVARNKLHASLAALESNNKEYAYNQSNKGEEHILHYHLHP